MDNPFLLPKREGTNRDCEVVTSEWNLRWTGNGVLKIFTCLMAVRNPCGLKNPVIQNTLGLPSKHHPLNWWFLSNRSVYQNPSVDDSHDIWSDKKVKQATIFLELCAWAFEHDSGWIRAKIAGIIVFKTYSLTTYIKNVSLVFHTFFQWVGIRASYIQSSESLRV